MDLQELVNGQNDFGLRILHQLLQIQGKDSISNAVFSPFSIYVILSMLTSGTGEGETRDDLLSFLKSNSVDQLNSFVSKLIAVIFSNKSSSGTGKGKTHNHLISRPKSNSFNEPCVTSANGVWIDESLPVKQSYCKVLETIYKARLSQVNFVNQADQAVKEANSWAKKKTRGLIKELIKREQVNGFTRLILGNAIYFKANWANRFDEKFTRDSDFHLLNGTSVQVPFMYGGTNRSFSVFDGLKVASIPYKGRNDLRNFSMWIFLPDALDGLHSLIERAYSEPGFFDRYGPKKNRVLVNIFLIPKVKFSYELKAVEILKKLGLNSIFTEGGFTEMAEFPAVEELFVSNISHEAVISIDEQGTEAAAITECGMELTGSCFQEKEEVRVDFVADHPFLFLIKENVTGTVLFIGQVLNPSVK